VQELRAILGFGNYYKDFIQDYSLIAHPLHNLTRKATPWKWEDEEQNAFDKLKHCFTSYPVLRNPNPNKHYILDTDASAFTVGTALQQDFKDRRHPITYFSKSLLPAERNYDIYDRELLAIIYMLKANRHLLLGTKYLILIRTDHNNLQYFKSPQKIIPRQAQWHEFLQDYHFELTHFPGRSNTIADLLSRRNDLEEGVNINENVTLLPQNLFVNVPVLPEYLTVWKIYLKDDDETRCKILQEIHDSPVGGHPGISNTWNLIK
jgi:hypothetical protein